MKRIKFNIPAEITLRGSCIKVVYDEDLGTRGQLGLWDRATNTIKICPGSSEQVQYETFCHEISEAINDKFVNEDEDGNQASHRIVDAYGCGLFNLLIENAGRLVRFE